VKKYFVLIAPVAALLFLSAAASAQNAAGNADNGKRIFLKNGCYSCHGYDGHGGVAPKLAPKPLAPAAFIAFVRHPSPSGMPTYSAKVMSDAELTDVVAYLRSIPEPPAVKDIPLLNQLNQ
jgi:ubiquinol-cytochrome c reductase cytochrome c subunit